MDGQHRSRRFGGGSRAASGFQYAVMVGLVGVVVLGAVTSLGGSGKTLFQTVSNVTQDSASGIGATVSPPPPTVSLRWSPEGDVSAMNIVSPATAGTPVTVRLFNDGNSASAAPALSLGGADPGRFEIASNGCTAAIPAGGSCAADIRATGSGNGAYAATLRAGTANDPALALSGSAGGFLAALSWSGGGGSMNVTAPATTGSAVTFTLSNPGAFASANLSGTISIGGADPGNFSLGANGCTGVLAPGASCTVQVTPAASGDGSYSAVLQTSADNAAWTSLTGTAGGFAPNLSWSGNGSGMNVTSPSTTGSAVTFTLSNTGGASADMTGSFSLGGASPGNFTITSVGCAGSLPRNGSCTVQVTPTASVSGSYSARLQTSIDNAPWASLSGTATGFLGECPTRYPTDNLTCTCSSTSFGSGSLWGDYNYTHDSTTCRAARHAGAIGAGGGTVTIRTRGGCTAYATATRNGITSSSYGNWSSSYYFVGVSSGSCTPYP